jgi:formate hydrogenlyase transcriptional activator
MRGVLEDAARKQILAALKQANSIVAGPKGGAALLDMAGSTLQAQMQRHSRLARGMIADASDSMITRCTLCS